MKKFLITILCYLILTTFYSKAQQVLEIEPLFEYPVAPDDLESLEERCNYLVKNFWNNFDFKSKKPLDQYALNEAFQVYVSPFRYADPKEVEASVDKLIKNVSSNPVLQLQMTKAAEENLYGPRAEFWSDLMYLRFIDAVIKNKKISDSRKSRYIKQEKALRNSMPGTVAPTFWFYDRERASKQYFPMTTPTMIIFGNPDNTDWRLARLRMESNFKLEEALEKGKINILYIIPGDIENWENDTSNYNSYWTVGQSKEAADLYDIRLEPTIYLVGSDGKITNKNINLNDAVNIILDSVN